MLKSLSPSNVRVYISNRSSGLGDTSVDRVKVSHMSRSWNMNLGVSATRCIGHFRDRGIVK
jgi:hypothetical protein